MAGNRLGTRCPAIIVAACGICAGVSGVAGQVEDPLPVSRITLYRSGVGFFERNGSVQGDAQINLRFDTDQINDILKSMVLLDLDGGRIDSVSYGSKEPLERRLASFGVNISDNPSVGALLGRLRGAMVKISMTEGDTTGTIIGVDRRIVPPDPGGKPFEAEHLNLLTNSGVRSIPLLRISSFELIDRELAGELTKALAALAEYRADRSKTVDISLSGDGSRRIIVGYVHEMPVWKTSYRLVLDDEPTTGAGDAQPMIQGWAIVENTTDHDWDNVRLALVSGRPVSFQMDLYEPLFTSRPMLPAPTIAGVMPRSYDAGINEALRAAVVDERYQKLAAGATMRGLEGRSSFGREPQPNQESVFFARLDADAVRLMDYAPAAQASAGQVGEVFQYELDAPVTIERQRSAMIPIISSAIEGRRVSIYNAADSVAHPMRGLELINDTRMQLLPGPLSVFDGSAYAGDAQIDHIGSGDKRLLAYAVDLEVAVLTEQEQNENVRRIRIVDGLIERSFMREHTITYGFENNDSSRDRTIIVEHPRFDGWELREPKLPAEQTQALYRFEVELKPGDAEALRVVQERTDRQSLEVRSFDMQASLAFHRDGKLSDDVLEVIREVASKQARIHQAEVELEQVAAGRQTIRADQDRIRSNMESISQNSDLYGRYMQKLNDQETRLEQLAQQQTRVREKIETIRRELRDYLKDLDVD